ncbi:MAG: TldD/PmbA family protein [Kofleriaceae bacterium]|nr:TldD/PmbA family protein [Myxococcales bacterium]MCB9562512.1 TldD/PmbA family protein [Kofleriaceae bacterium]MCB9570727.1 TldD/PmbA family protein [Kofleriaceae bacterium]
MRRRDFLKGVGAGGLLVACGGRSGHPTPPAPLPDVDLMSLADVALDAARSAGATYADVRIADYRTQGLWSREARVESISEAQDRGFGVRVIADGTWGFAASGLVTHDEVVRVARRAVTLAKVNARLQREPVVLAPVEAQRAVWATPIRRDPFDVALDDKTALLLGINAAAMAVPGVSFCESGMWFVREHKFFASTDGSYIEQTLHRCQPWFEVTSIDAKQGSFQTRSTLAHPRSAGYEYFEDHPWTEEAAQAGEDAVAKHSAPSVEPGVRDLILHPTHLWLTIHESIGHPTELDRAVGLEANFAGTSFLTVDKLGQYEFGSELVTAHGEKTHPGSLATCGFDDDGVPTTEAPLIERGRFVGYQTTRDQAAWIGADRSTGTSYADSWGTVAFQRMPNVNLLPGARPLSLADLIADTEDAILIKGDGSWSIDHQRYNFQFGGQLFYEVKHGKITRMINDVAYQARTPDFWHACDAICDESEYYVGGTFSDGKGEPGQANAVSHGCAPARFRGVNVLNTKRSV